MAKTYETKDTTKRTHLVGAKLSDDELARFRYICERLNVTQSEYIREAILTAKVTRPTVVTAMDRRRSVIKRCDSSFRHLRRSCL